MKIVYVGDNRNRGNYGCRATSTALSQLISENNEIVGRITGRYNMFDLGNLFYISFLPTWFYILVSKIPGWNKVGRLWNKVICKVLRRKYYYSAFDFVGIDPKTTRRNLLKCIKANKTIQEFDLRNYDFDTLIVNGEGSFIFANPPWRESLVIAMLMDWAQEMGKDVFFLNAMLSDDPNFPHNEKTIKMFKPILEKCERVSVRENVSFEYCKKFFPGANVKLIPDALFTWYDLINDGHIVTNGKYYMPHVEESDEFYKNYDFTEPYICVAGSSSYQIGANQELAIQSYSNLVEKIKTEFGLKVYIMQVCEGDAFLKVVGKITSTSVIPLTMPIVSAGKILANASLFISGRYHPAILASLGGTPCVLMGSNSHKTISLQELLQYDNPHEYEVLPDINECTEIIKEARRKYNRGIFERNRIKNRCQELNKLVREQIVRIL